jgi:YD repeat-containing protein
VAYFVSAYGGGPGASAYSIPDSTQPGTSYAYDGLGRQTSTTDPLGDVTYYSYQVVCNDAGMNDPACYEMTLVVDPLNHLSADMADALGRIDYEQRTTGNSTYVLYATSKYTYDYAGHLIQILHPDGASKTTYQYDMAGREVGMTDPDRGTETYSYDQDGNQIQSVDARGASGTVYVGYDGIEHIKWCLRHVHLRPGRLRARAPDQ